VPGVWVYVLLTTKQPDRIHTPRPDVQHWWAVEAMIASYNHVYKVTYNTKYEVHGPIGVSIYDGAPIASFHYEFLALSPDPDAVMDAVLSYPIPEGKQFNVDVFHTDPSITTVKRQYQRYDFECVRTGPILGLELREKVSAARTAIYEATTIKQAETANHSLTTEGERIHLQTLRDKHIHSFYVTVGGEAVGWVQLVTIYPGVAYINQLYVLEAFRRMKLGAALIHHAQNQAIDLGFKRIVSVPSEMAIPLYRRLGYRPLLYFTAFRPVPFRKF
jgi:ribosomal protein S18 acetylase RimI-like enzyme